MTGRRLRVLVVAWWYPSAEHPYGGIFVRDHARAAARDSDVAVLAFAPDGALPAGRFRLHDGVEDGLRTLRIRHARTAAPAAYVPAVAAVARRLARGGFKPDVVHAHVFMGALLAAPPARWWRAPLVYSEHLGAFQLPGMAPTEELASRAALRLATVVCPPSASLRRALERRAPRARFRVVSNVVDTGLFHPPDGPRPDGRIVYVGSLEEVKGVGPLLDAAARLHRRGTPFALELVGDGTRRSEYEATARRHGLEDVVRFRGALARPAVADALRGATLLVVPSLTESFGIAAAEALASGLPVVGSRTGALPELIDEANGVLVAPGDAEALAGALERMLARHRDYDAAALAAGVAARAPDAIADAWSALYAQVTARSRPGT